MPRSPLACMATNQQDRQQSSLKIRRSIQKHRSNQHLRQDLKYSQQAKHSSLSPKKAKEHLNNITKSTPATMDFTPGELEEVKKRMSEIMQDIMQEQKELEKILEFIESLSRDDMQRISESTSSTRRNRNIADIRSAEEEKQSYEEMRVAKEQSLGNLWMKIHELQVKERELEKGAQGSGDI